MDRYEDEGLDGLADKHLEQVSALRAPVDEVVCTETLYRERYRGWNVMHFYSFYRREHGGGRSYTWGKNSLQRAGLVAKAPGRGRHRRRRERAPVAGMMLHQDGSTHEWTPGQHWDRNSAYYLGYEDETEYLGKARTAVLAAEEILAALLGPG